MSSGSKVIETCGFIYLLSMMTIAGCKEDEDEDKNFDFQCESFGTSITLSTLDARPSIVAAAAQGCGTSLATVLSCGNPVSEVRFSSNSGPGLCTFTLTSSNGQTFVASSSIQIIKLDNPYTCRDDYGAPHLIDSYLGFNPPAITVDFTSNDAGNTDSLGCAEHDAGVAHDAQ